MMLFKQSTLLFLFIALATSQPVMDSIGTTSNGLDTTNNPSDTVGVLKEAMPTSNEHSTVSTTVSPHSHICRRKVRGGHHTHRIHTSQSNQTSSNRGSQPSGKTAMNGLSVARLFAKILGFQRGH